MDPSYGGIWSQDGKPAKAPELVYWTAEEFLHEQLLPGHVSPAAGAR
ncbi:hypothetical protein [Arthrobacter sp. ES3-54]|jgi:hypothetical protein|nr:hypothetical protein [Arthrobacter sp. ES3-54]MDF9750435.1 hypothetical protein [Arthrobacter sp. ES3-54]